MRPKIVDMLAAVIDHDLANLMVPSGTMMYVVAMLAVMTLYVKRCERTGLSPYHALGSSLYAMISGLAGARLFYLVETWESTLRNPAVLLDVFGGTTSWGAYLGGMTGYFAYYRLHGITAGAYADAFGASLGLGPCIGRWSCFLHGCCYGTPSSLPWAVGYPPASPPFQSQFMEGLIPADSPASIPLHPIQLYLSMSACLVFVLTSMVWHRRRSSTWLTFLVFWMLYALFRWPIEFVRGEVPRLDALHLNLAQVMCILLMGTTGILLLLRNRQKTRSLAGG